jgi:hypothetical protein
LADVVAFKLSVPFLRTPASGGTGVPVSLEKVPMENPPQAKSSPTVPDPPAAAARTGRVPVELRDLDMRIASDGTWYYRGSPINRPALVKLFASVLRREDDGSYWLVTPAERGRVVVDDAPFVAVSLDIEGEGQRRRLIFRSNLDEIVAAGPEHKLRVETAPDGTPSPYILMRPGLEARLARPVFYELADLGIAETIDGERKFGVWSDGMFFELGDPGEDEE